MGLLVRNPVVISLIIWSLCWLPHLAAQSTIASPRTLDALLQDYAYRAFVNPRTGIVYNGTVPSNLTGIRISGLRLKNGSLRFRGVKKYKEFEIPVGVLVQPYVERLVLVYHNLGNWSNFYYPLTGYTFLSPVLGLIAYDARNLSATNLNELDIRASMNPILIHFSNVNSMPAGSVAKCVSFDLQGTVSFSNVVSKTKTTCSTVEQGHFALVMEGIAPSPAPMEPPHKKQKKNMKKMWIIVGSVVGGVLVLVVMALLLACLKKFQHKKKMQHMEKASEGGETLRMTTVGSAKAPTAMVTRTQPILETEYVP